MITRPPITRSGAQHDAQRELSKAIYHRNSDPLPVRAVKWAGHLLDHFFHTTLKHAPAGDFGALALIIVVLAVAAVIIWRVGIPRRTPAMGAVLQTDSTLTAAQHRQLASDAAGQQDWRTAVIERMRALARELEERSILDPRAGRTATELAREAAVRVATASAALQAAANTFNRVAYGGSSASVDDLATLVRADDAVQAAARSKVLVG